MVVIPWQLSKKYQFQSINTSTNKHNLMCLVASHSHVVDEAPTQMVYTRLLPGQLSSVQLLCLNINNCLIKLNVHIH